LTQLPSLSGLRTSPRDESRNSRQLHCHAIYRRDTKATKKAAAGHLGAGCILTGLDDE
jgi:hypothetical protein